MRTTVQLTGFKELEAKLATLKDATAKNKMRAVLRKAAKPVADRARELAPRDEGDLADSIKVSPTLNRSQRRQNRKGSFADLEMHIGPSGLVQGITQEFGTVNHPAQPFMRSAWEGGKDKVLDDIGKLAWAEINKKARRR